MSQSHSPRVDFASWSFGFWKGSGGWWGKGVGGNDGTFAHTRILLGIYNTLIMSYHCLSPQVFLCRLCQLELPEPWVDKRDCSVGWLVVVAVVVVVIPLCAPIEEPIHGMHCRLHTGGVVHAKQRVVVVVVVVVVVCMRPSHNPSA